MPVGVMAAGVPVGCRPEADTGCSGPMMPDSEARPGVTKGVADALTGVDMTDGVADALTGVDMTVGIADAMTGVGGAPMVAGSLLMPGGGLKAEAMLRGPGGPIWPSTKGAGASGSGRTVWKEVLDKGLEPGAAGLESTATLGLSVPLISAGVGLKGGSSAQHGR